MTNPIHTNLTPVLLKDSDSLADHISGSSVIYPWLTASYLQTWHMEQTADRRLPYDLKPPCLDLTVPLSNTEQSSHPTTSTVLPLACLHKHKTACMIRQSRESASSLGGSCPDSEQRSRRADTYLDPCFLRNIVWITGMKPWKKLKRYVTAARLQLCTDPSGSLHGDRSQAFDHTHFHTPMRCILIQSW